MLSTSQIFTSFKICVDLLFNSKKSAKLKFFYACALDLIVVLFSVSAPILLKKLIDALDSSADTSGVVYWLGIGYGAIWLCSELLLRVRAYITTEVIEEAKIEALRRLCKNSIFKFDSRSRHMPAGEFSAKMAQLLYALPIFIDGLTWQVIPLIIRLVLSVSALALFAPLIYPALLILCVITFLSISVFTHTHIGDKQRNANLAMQHTSSTIIDALNNKELTIAHATELHEIDNISKSLVNSKRSAVKSMAYTQLVSSTQILFLGIGLLIITLKSIFDVKSGVSTLGGLVQINAYVLQFLLPVSYFGMVISGIKRASVALEENRLSLIDSEFPECLPSSFPLKPSSISITNFKLKSSDGKSYLKDINLNILPGECIALVGNSGAGKTSLIKSIIGLVEPESGSVKIDDTLVTKNSSRTLRKKIGYVPQEPHLFNRSLLDNIFTTETTSAERNKILDLSGITLDSLAANIDKTCADLSGGEKQRVAFARALARTPSILILDEPSSSLDVYYRGVISNTLFTQCKDTTRIIITHDLDLASQADRVIVMESGRIIQSGSHDQLIEEDNWYKTYWHKKR
ncbi:ATP-binding cassette domain-containing protein [Marinomonas polaris]|uniref:ATP-binding cassette domain-containing protein n=1 Tax=Marinomonas polaris TaxID=293552 RepID=UPI003512D214